MTLLTKLLKAILPGNVFYYLMELKFSRFSKLSTKEVFRKTYLDNVWGGTKGEFNSGWGTTDSQTELYIQEISSFIKKNKINNILDIGCGDFRIMSQVLERIDHKEIKYTGADIVDELIDHHNNKYGNKNIKFICLDASQDQLPYAELVTVRQILQHLSNAQITSILEKLNKYKYVIITELLPSSPNRIPNLNKLAGPHDRTGFNSGVFIDLPPFSMRNTTTILEYPHDDQNFLRTSLIEND